MTNNINKKVKREWCCERCKQPININVNDNERTFVNDGGKLFCSNFCSTNKFIPLDLKKAPVKKGKSKKQKMDNSKSQFKCFNCGKIHHYMTWNKRCGDCCENGINDGSERLMKL